MRIFLGKSINDYFDLPLDYLKLLRLLKIRLGYLRNEKIT